MAFRVRPQTLLRQTIAKASRQTKVAVLKAGGLTNKVIAETLGVGEWTVSHDLSELRDDGIEDILKQAQQRIREVMPVKTRVDKYVAALDLAESTRQPAAMMQVLTRLDAMDGVVTAGEQLRAKHAGSEQRTVPMFALPAGTQVNVMLTTTGSKDHNKVTLDDAIDVTPTDTASE